MHTLLGLLSLSAVPAEPAEPAALGAPAADLGVDLDAPRPGARHRLGVERRLAGPQHRPGKPWLVLPHQLEKLSSASVAACTRAAAAAAAPTLCHLF